MNFSTKILICILTCFSTQAADSQSLFNGKDMAGWTTSDGPDHWTVEDGQLVGENQDKKGSILWTEQEFKDFELTLDYQTPSPDYDSGVFTRNISHQVQIGVSRSLKVDLTGCIYAPKDKQGSYPARTDKVQEFHKLGEWNHLRVIVKGKRIQTFLNGEPFVDYEGITIPEKGPLGLQLHGNVHMKMLFKNIELTPLVD